MRAAGGRREEKRPGPVRADRPVDARAYWRGQLRLTIGLLLVWALAAFAGVYFARQLNQGFFGWPFGFFWAALGAPLSFVAIVAVYAWRMAVRDRRLEAGEPWLAGEVAGQDRASEAPRGGGRL